MPCDEHFTIIEANAANMLIKGAASLSLHFNETNIECYRKQIIQYFILNVFSLPLSLSLAHLILSIIPFIPHISEFIQLTGAINKSTYNSSAQR